MNRTSTVAFLLTGLFACSSNEAPSEEATPDIGQEADAAIGSPNVRDAGEPAAEDMGLPLDLGVDVDMSTADMGQEPRTPSFTEDLYPMFEGFGCTSDACHGTFLQAGGFAYLMTDAEIAFIDAIDRPSIREPRFIVEPGAPDESVMFTHGRDANLLMGDLDEEGLALIRTWIQAGAPFGPAPEPEPPFEPGVCSFEGSSGFVPLPDPCLPRCSASTWEAVQACASTSCQSEALDDDMTPPIDLDLVTDMSSVNCRTCFDWQTQSCLYDHCSSELLAVQRCRFLEGPAACEAETNALSQCALADEDFNLCRGTRLRRCADL